MIDYTALESGIVERLSILSSEGIDVVNVPEDEQGFKRPVVKARISVAYSSSKWGDIPGTIRSTSAVSQLETMEFVIMIQSRRIRGERGIHETIRRVRKRLKGFALPGCDRLYFVSGSFEANAYEEGTWSYSIVTGCTALSVQDEEDEYGDFNFYELPTDPTNEILITNINVQQNL